MKRTTLICALAILIATGVAQTKQTTTKKTATASTQKKTATTSKTTTTRTQSAAKKPQTTAKKGTTATKKKTAAKKPAAKTPTYTNAEIKGLQNQRTQVQQKIKQQEQALRANQADVKKRLQNLMVLNNEISERQKNISGIENDISHIDDNIGLLKAQLQTLEQQLAERKRKYVTSMRNMTRQHTIQDRLMFIFSAKSFTQMYRRARFVKEYAAYQRAQGEAVKAKQAQINEKNKQLEDVRFQKNTLLWKGKKEREQLQGQQSEQQKMVTDLQKQQKSIQKIIDDQKKKDASLNAQIDRLIAIEVEKARQRAAAEAKRKAEAAAAAKKRAEELARKKAAAEAAERENRRRIAEAKAKEERAKALAAEAAKKDAAEKARAEQAAREARAAREAAERKAKVDAERSKKELAQVKKKADDAQMLTAVDRKLSGGFESNKGRLPIPITGSYRIVSHFGQYNVEGLSGVRLDNKGINILGTSGCQARSIYEGEVSAVFGYSGQMVVMVRHGSYISVYCNLKSVSVSRGQKVSTRQILGTVGQDNILQFQLRKETAKLNPEAWLGR